jgi:hypothetical protein
VATLNAAQRKALSTKVFGLPEKRAYPMEDKTHARAAMSRASANATPAEQKRIRAKAHRMYPGMASGMDASKMHSLSSMSRC